MTGRGMNPPAPSRRPAPGHDAEEARRIAEAAHFVLTCKVAGGFTRQEHPTLASAVAAAGAGPRAVIYAVSPRGLSWPLSRTSWGA